MLCQGRGLIKKDTASIKTCPVTRRIHIKSGTLNFKLEAIKQDIHTSNIPIKKNSTSEEIRIASCELDFAIYKARPPEIKIEISENNNFMT